jgi:NodT family efflux transporter outer membrane factor (OMF) lipoprotein
MLRPLHNSVLLLFASLPLVFTLSGCRVGPNYQRPSAPTPPSLSTPPPAPANGAWKTSAPADEFARGKWWQLFHEPELNALEEKISVSNQSLVAATKQYQESLEALHIAKTAYSPTLSAGVSPTREKFSSNRPQASPSAQTEFTDLVVGGQASWEPDLWGSIHRSVEQSRSNAQASAADLANLQLSLQAQLALSYFELRGLDLQKQLLTDTLADYTRQRELTRNRLNGGVGTEADVAQAETQLESTRAQLTDLGVARAQCEHAIATLTGQPASGFAIQFRADHTALPQIPPVVASDLLERRPDVAAAERRTQAANAQIGIAIAAYYPNILLGGTGGFESTHGGTWINGPSSLWSLGASATQLLFDAGKRKALTVQAREGYDAQVANYRQTVLGSFQEVEDNLSALRILADEAATQDRAVASAQQALDIASNRYKGGVTSYLEVLIAENALLANQRTQAELETRRVTAAVSLIKALGGGWTTAQLPKP